MKLRGGPELRARLQSVIAAGPEIQRAWADEAASRIKENAPRRTGALADSIEPGEKDGKAVVRGNYYGVILDRGTKSYPITPKKQGGTLRFSYRGRAIFAKKADRRKLRRRPFITKGAQDALASSAPQDAIVKAWSRKRSTGRFSKL